MGTAGFASFFRFFSAGPETCFYPSSEPGSDREEIRKYKNSEEFPGSRARTVRGRADNKKSPQYQYIAGLFDGGRDKDRTCDPYDVNVVLYR